MSYKFEGEVKVVMDTQAFDSGFKKREVIVTSTDQYPQDVKFEFLKDDVDMLDAIKPNQSVVINFNLRGNEYNGKFFTNLVAFSISKMGGVKTPVAVKPEIAQADADDELPF